MAASNSRDGKRGGNRGNSGGNGQNKSTDTYSNSAIIEAKETFANLYDLSKLLNTGLDADSLALCVRLCERGAHPEALATVIRELRRESEAIRQEQ